MRIFFVSLIFMLTAFPGWSQTAETRRTAWEIVQDMRRIATLLRPNGQGVASEAELRNYEQNLAIILDTDVQKQYLCNGYGVAIMAEHAAYAIAPSQSDPPQLPASGSLDARMHMMARILLPAVLSGNVSVFRAGQTIGWECRTQRIEHVVNAHIPMGSAEMQNEIACYNDLPTCVRNDDDWEDEPEEPPQRAEAELVEQPVAPIKRPKPPTPSSKSGTDLSWMKDVSRRQLWSAILSDAEKGKLKGSLAGYEKLLETVTSDQSDSIAPCEAKAGEIAQDTVDRFSPKPTNPHAQETLDFKLTQIANGLMDGTMTYGTPDFPGVKRLLTFECRYQFDQGNF